MYAEIKQNMQPSIVRARITLLITNRPGGIPLSDGDPMLVFLVGIGAEGLGSKDDGLIGGQKTTW